MCITIFSFVSLFEGGCFEITLATQSAKLGPLNLILYYLEILEGAISTVEGLKYFRF